MMWDINGILDRLERQKHLIPEETFRQIANPDYYYPPCQESFHDAWLIDLNTRYGDVEELLKHAFKPYDIVMRLLGPYHNMVHTIRYLGVVSHEVAMGKHAGDLLEHAFEIDDGHIVHEITFVDGRMRFVCADVRIETTML